MPIYAAEVSCYLAENEASPSLHFQLPKSRERQDMRQKWYFRRLADAGRTEGPHSEEHLKLRGFFLTLVEAVGEPEKGGNRTDKRAVLPGPFLSTGREALLSRAPLTLFNRLAYSFPDAPRVTVPVAIRSTRTIAPVRDPRSSAAFSLPKQPYNCTNDHSQAASNDDHCYHSVSPVLRYLFCR
jgi:hypothetical protein